MTEENKTQLSVDEIVATLRNSSLPTLLVEGRSDMAIFRSLENLCFSGAVDVLPTGSREALLEIFQRRSEYESTPVAFLADADMYVFTGAPTNLFGVTFTSGFSIENDILSGGMALRVISKKHLPIWNKILAALCEWFAAVVHRSLAGETIEYSQHPNQLVNFNTGKLKPTSLKALLGRAMLCPEAQTVFEEPVPRLRGHTLLDALGHFLAVTKHSPKCSKDFLLQIDLLSWELNPRLKRLITELQAALSPLDPSGA